MAKDMAFVFIQAFCWGGAGSVRMAKIVFPESADFIGQGGSLIERGLRGAVKVWVRSKSLLVNMNFGEMTLSPEHSDILPFR